ncbi:TetR/AcrR family transcriptional regulator [Lactiplantibacillus sp. WILCCON 0030]|uniref:TetR/AcrR family transcriptional regulator n=1 Tax=Lactiplantibacillus brownii TaxID=3069269 RepID=A0ABU1A630_9LACO|nr:TetR/AcrR family transcriptional regulator [Lactiplantibacillus brownii]MDQ7936361.1 TetR/AcrR family transcriptional regulator [Lactiplantibacillus brownii]
MAATNHAQSIKQDSRDYLTTALLQLLETKDLNVITVTQVVKRAGVSRMAFYRNFETLDDVLVGYFRPAIASRFNDVLTGVAHDDKLTAMDQFFVNFAATMRLAVDRGFEHIIRQIFNENMVAFYRQNMHWQGISQTQQRYWTQFMSAGVYAIWREWLLGGQQETLNEVHDLIATFQHATMAALMTVSKERKYGDG